MKVGTLGYGSQNKSVQEQALSVSVSSFTHDLRCLSRMIVCCVLHKTKLFLVKHYESFFNREKYSHLTIYLSRGAAWHNGNIITSGTSCSASIPSILEFFQRGKLSLLLWLINGAAFFQRIELLMLIKGTA